MMFRGETLQTNWELDVTRTNDVLDLEVGELGIETELLDDPGVFARGKLRVIFRLCTGDDHLARGEDECGCLWVADSHDYGSKSLQQSISTVNDVHMSLVSTYLWVVLSITSVQRNGFEVKPTVQVDRSDDVSLQNTH